MHQWIDHAAALDAWLSKHESGGVIGVDTEFMRTNTFRSVLALMQINLGGDIALLDSPRLGAHAGLRRLLTAPEAITVMHSASEDLEAMIDVLPDGPSNLFDTQIAAAMTGFGFGLSYQKLVATLLGVDLPKAETRSDWLARPLSASQLEYAAQDVVHLPAIHATLDARLGELGRRQWLAEDCRRLVERVCHPTPDTQPQRAFRTAHDWPIEQRVRLRRLLLWRDAQARKLDKPRSWLLDDAHALDFASQPPADGDELFERAKGLRALRGPQRTDLLAEIQQPIAEADHDIAPIPAPFNNAERRSLQSMRDAVTAVAQRENIPEGLLGSRRHLETLLTDRSWPAALDGWRRPLLHDALMALL